MGAATAKAPFAAGRTVAGTNLMRGLFEQPEPGVPTYIQADLTQPGDAFVRGARRKHRHALRRHPGADPEPGCHGLLQNNLMATFNVLEATVRFGVSRFVNVSSETAPGFFLPGGPVPAG